MTDQQGWPAPPQPELATLIMLPSAAGAPVQQPESGPEYLAAAPALGGPAQVPAPAEPVEGTVTPAMPVEKVLGDEDDDRPLLPPWMRSAEGWARFAGVFYRARRRDFRRWVRRQRTERGHLAQFGRGARRLHEWVRGFEGFHVDAARTQAITATREARQAARAARFTPGLMKEKKARAQAAADRAQTAALSAVNAHRQARKARSRARNLRAGVVYGPPVAAISSGYVTAGWVGATAGALATFAGGAFAGRKPLVEESWSAEWRSLGDGDMLTAQMLTKVFQAAKVIGNDENLSVVRMPMRELKAWSAVVDLPPGITAKKALKACTEIAGAFGVEEAQLHMSKAGRAGRLEIFISDHLPFSEDVVEPGPLLAAEGPTNLWRPVAIGPDVRGDRYSISLVERSGLIGGEPGAGKSASGNTILLAAALDPRVLLHLADGKGGGDLEPFQPLCERFEGDADPEAFDAMLDEEIADMGVRYRLLKKLGKRKVTEELADKHPQLRQKLLWVDELMFYTTDEDYGKKITKKLRNLVSRGRAAGIITICATQKPGSDVVDTSLRDLLSMRWALRCTTPEASDTILGKGAASSGYSAKTIEPEMRGAGYLWAEGSNPRLVRADYYTDEQVESLVERAYEYRKAAGTLPTGPASLADQLREQGEPDAEVLAVLVEAFDDYTAKARQQARDEGKDDQAVTVDWLPGAVLLERLAEAGLDITAERLASLVTRTEEDKKKKQWEGSRVAGYPLARVLQVARDRYGLTA
ncbi:FtsK/SpoIIIE domain-containing protein [Streptomyces albus]|uniref:FtsK/SpoIIIE domain-containing protein n=1 Tax=Streptomyces albus TaxID=1888 RepID=UPI0033C27D94